MSTVQADEKSNGLCKSERESMLVAVQNMIAAEVKRAGIPRRHREDVEQELQMLLWEMTAKFDPTRGVKWSTFACSCLRNKILNWKAGNRAEEGPGAVVCIGATKAFDDLMRERAITYDPVPEEPKEPGEQTMSALAVATQRILAEGILCQLPPAYRRLVELVVFEGLYAGQIATQDGHPVKVVRANIKGALRKLCALGLANHVATDEEIAAATKARNSVDRLKVNAVTQKKNHERADAAVVAGLDGVATDGAFTVELDKLDPDMRVVVRALIDRSFNVDEAVELMGGNRQGVVNQLRKVTRRVKKNGAVAQADQEQAKVE